MKPKFKNVRDWEQAQLLMQPAFIRVIDNLRKQLEESSWKGAYEEITEPFPGYQLHLTRGEEAVDIEIWNLCFQICFLDYQPLPNQADSYEVEIDTSLIDETGDLDWQLLETKTQRLIKEFFESLPDNQR